MFHLYPSIPNSIWYPEYIAIAFFNGVWFSPPLHFPEVLSRYPQIQYVNFGKKNLGIKMAKNVQFHPIKPKIEKKGGLLSPTFDI